MPALASEASAALAKLLLSAAQSGQGEMLEIRIPWPLSNMTREDWAQSIRLWQQHGVPMLREQPSRPCPGCGQDDGEPLFTSHDGHPYVECQACRTWYVPLQVDYGLYERFFARCPEARRFGDYTQTQIEDSSLASSDRERFGLYYRELLTILPETEGRKRSTLDIGCGVGNSLVVAEELGFDAVGLEVNEKAVSIARRLGRSVVFPTQVPPDQRFDLITLWEAIEHLDDPLTVLRDAAGLMEPGGLLALTTPNLNSPSIRGMRADSMHILGGPAWAGHINIYTQESLKKLLVRAGFEMIDAWGQYTMNLYEFVAYQLGLWSGARSHLRGDDPAVSLPANTARLLETVSTVVAAWEEQFAMAPVLRIIAQRQKSSPPASAEVMAQRRVANIAERLEVAYGSSEPPATPARRGEALTFSEARHSDAATSINSAGGLEVSGETSGPLTYLWTSHPIRLPATALVLARGKLFRGGMSVGLLQGDSWAALSSRTSPGPFEVTVGPVQAGEYSLVVSNNSEDAAGTELTIDRLEVLLSDDAQQHVLSLQGKPTSQDLSLRTRSDALDLIHQELKETLSRASLTFFGGWRQKLVTRLGQQLQDLRREIDEHDSEIQNRVLLLNKAEKQVQQSLSAIKQRELETQTRAESLPEVQTQMEDLMLQVQIREREISKRDGLLREVQRQVQDSLTEIGKRDSEIQRRDLLLQEVQQQVDDLVLQIHSRDREVQERDQLLQKVQRQVQESLAEIGKREAEIEKRDLLLQDVQQQVNGLMSQIESRDREVIKRDQLLQEVQRQVQESLAEISKREAEIQRRDAMLQETQLQVDGLMNQMREKDRELSERDERLRRIELKLRSDSEGAPEP